MRLGVSVTSALSADDPREAGRWLVERAAAANRAGLDHLTLGDHHATGPGSYWQNTPTLGRLAAEFPDRPIGCLFLVPLWHPILMAEQIATLAGLTNARFIVQTGLGSGDDQFAAMGVPMSSRRWRLEEGIDVVQRLLAGETVDHERFGIVGAEIGPLPPEPVEWWIGAMADAALERAARVGDCWYAPPGLTPDQVGTRAEAHRRLREQAGRGAGGVAVRNDVIVTADGSIAERLADDLVAAGYRGMRREQVVAGSVDRVAERLAAYEAAGATDHVLRCMSVPQDVAVETIELLGEVRRSLG